MIHARKLLSIMVLFLLVLTGCTTPIVDEDPEPPIDDHDDAPIIDDDGVVIDGNIEELLEQQTKQIVYGYVVGQPVDSNTILFDEFSRNDMIAIADHPLETDPSKMVFLELPDAYESIYGLESNPNRLSDYIYLEGYVTTRLEHPAVSKIETMYLISEIGEAVHPLDLSYYKTALSKTGEDLKEALHLIISGHTELSYDDVWEALQNTDEDPSNPDNVILLYTGWSLDEDDHGGFVDQWNREHVWAKSHGDFGTRMGAGTDLHHLKPTDVTVNSSRGNKDFDEGGQRDNECSDCYHDSDSWEPSDRVKGDIARMLFYMAVRYEGTNDEPDLELNDLVNNGDGKSPYMGRLSLLLEWHLEDPVDDFERRRNEIIYEDYQHNRNPFIDHPEWVELIWDEGGMIQ